MTSVPPCPDRAPTVPPARAKTPESDRAPVPLSIGTGTGHGHLGHNSPIEPTESVPPVCQSCRTSTDNRPAVCSTCWAERVDHRLIKAQRRRADLTKRTTPKESEVKNPEAPLSVAVYTGGRWTLRLVCPHCSHVHSHGGGTDPNPEVVRSYLGHRAGHCPSECETHGRHDRGGYVLTDPSDLIGEMHHAITEADK
ncbi:hypothetical protein GCM10027599_26640 [Yimella radicis]